MARQSIDQAGERFMASVIEVRDMIDAFEARVAADDWTDEAEMLLAMEALGRAGSRMYNAQKALAGGAPFGLKDVVRSMKPSKPPHEAR